MSLSDSEHSSRDFVTSDDESYFDYEDFIYEEETSEDVSYEASDESDLDIVDAFPITAHRQKYIVRYDEFIYY